MNGIVCPRLSGQGLRRPLALRRTAFSRKFQSFDRSTDDGTGYFVTTYDAEVNCI
jgi:hypothetical protein